MDWASIATYHLHVDWDGDGDMDTIAEEHVSDDMLSLSFKRGRDYASQLTGRSVAGRMSAVLDNTSGRYSPFLTTSPLSGLLLPGRVVQLTAMWKGTTYTLFTGRLLTLRPKPDRGGVHTCELSAIGPLGYINQGKPKTIMQTMIRTDEAVDFVLDEADWPAGERDISVGQTTMERWWADGKITTLNVLRAIEETERGFIRETRDGKIAFEDRHFRLSSAYQTPSAEFRQDNTALYYRQIEEEDPLSEIFNDFTLDLRQWEVQPLDVLWTAPRVFGIRHGESFTVIANYPDANHNEGVLGVDAWTTPVPTTDYTANEHPNGLLTDLTGFVSVSSVKHTTGMEIVLTNTHPSLTAYITFLQARGTALLELDLLSLVKRDLTSQSLYGVRDYPVPTKWLSDVDEGTDYLNFLASVYTQPLPVEQIETVGNVNDDHMVAILSLDISDRVTVQNENLGIEQDFFIEGMSHTIYRSGIHQVVYELSDAQSYSDFWVIGFSALGYTTRLAY